MLQRIRQAFQSYNANWRQMPLHIRAMTGGVSGFAAGGIAYLLVPAQPHVNDFLTSLAGHTLLFCGVFLPVQYLGYRLWLRTQRRKTPPEGWS